MGAQGPIRHSVVFRLRHDGGSEAEATFLAAAQQLAEIPVVEDFVLFDEVSPKNAYRFGLSMTFADQVAYDTYNSHPDHLAFVRDRWVADVADFLEIDGISRPTPRRD